MQVIYLEVRKIYQPGYSGGRGERQKIYLVLEYELSSVAGILCVTVRPERTPRKISFWREEWCTWQRTSWDINKANCREIVKVLGQ